MRTRAAVLDTWVSTSIGSLRLRALRSRLKSVEGTWIVAEDFINHLRADLSLIPQLAQRFDLAGIVGMAIIGADDEIIFAGISEDVLEVVVGLAGDINPVILQDLRAKLFAAALVSPRQIMDRIRDPLRADFDNRNPQFRKLFRDALDQKGVKCADHSQFEFAEARLVKKKIVRVDTAVGRMNANRQINLLAASYRGKK